MTSNNLGAVSQISYLNIMPVLSIGAAKRPVISQKWGLKPNYLYFCFHSTELMQIACRLPTQPKVPEQLEWPQQCLITPVLDKTCYN